MALDYDRWTGPSGGSSQPRRRNGLIQRHLWPPSVPGFLVIAVIGSVCMGLIGGYCYTQSGSAKVVLQDPSGPEPIVEAPVASSPADQPTTTKPNLSVEALGDKVAPSIWRVNTLDEAGRPIEASAVVAGSFGGQSFLLTTFAAVRASTRVPGPPLVVRNGGSESPATLWTWQEDRDLALLVISRAAPPLLWATENPEGKPGQRVFVAAAGASLVPGTITSSSSNAILHTITTDDRRQGGALINEKGEVLGMVSRDYNPGGVATDRIFAAVPMQAACAQVLQCAGGNATVPSATSATTTTTR